MGKIVKVSNDMQKNYSYELTEPIGKNFDPKFNPELTPKQMLSMGIFGGKYFNDVAKTNEYPKDWFSNAKLSTTRDASLNYFKINASQSLKVWKKNGWIHKDDPRGWFEWYCRYYMGRRHPDDARQIGRWRKITRHIGQVKNSCSPGDSKCRMKQKQAILHWAYDSRKL